MKKKLINIFLFLKGFVESFLDKKFLEDAYCRAAFYTFMLGIELMMLVAVYFAYFLKANFFEAELSAIILWSAIYISLGFRVINPKEFLVIERFGKFYRIVHPGITVICGFIDRVVYNSNSKYQRKNLYQDEPNNVDFQDGSAPVSMQVWWKIGDPAAEMNGDVKQLEEDICAFVYVATNPINKLEEVIDAFVRPLLQRMTIDGANIGKESVASSAMADEGLKNTLKEVGIYLEPKKGCLITDINLPPEIIKLREMQMEGKKDAERSSARGRGYAQAITAIMEEAKDAGSKINFKEAQEIFERQRGLEVVGSTGANVSFVAPDIHGVMKTLDIGSAKKRA